MNTQKQDILDYLNAHGSLTRMEAFSELGVCELASRIGELEKDGHGFTRTWLEGKARNGRRWRVVRYALSARPEAGCLTTSPGTRSLSGFATPAS